MNTQQVHEHLEELLHDSEIPDNTMELVPVRNAVKRWACQNAYLLIYFAVIGAIGWGFMIVEYIRAAT